MHNIIRFGAKKGFQAFPGIATYGSIGNELGSEQGLYLPASIIQSHARAAQERGAQGIEKCLVYSKKSASSRYHVVALILPVDAGKPEWRDGAFVGVAVLAFGQMIREVEALAVLESDLQELLSEHPISTGQEEGVEPLNWKTSSRSAPVSLFSDWLGEDPQRNALLVPAYNASENWHSRVASALTKAAGLERVIVLPWQDAAPNISGWTANGPSIGSRPINAPRPGHEDDIKRLTEALEQKDRSLETLTEENDRLSAGNRNKNQKRFAALVATGLFGLCLGAGISWWVLQWEGIQPPVGPTGIGRSTDSVPHQYYWESLAFRSTAKKKLGDQPVRSTDYLKYALCQQITVERALCFTDEKVGPHFFEWRFEDIQHVLNSLYKNPYRESSICIPCLKYGIIEYVGVEGCAPSHPLSFSAMCDSIRQGPDSIRADFLDELFKVSQLGFLRNGEVVAVQIKLPRENTTEPWATQAAQGWVRGDDFKDLDEDAITQMIKDLTQAVDEESDKNNEEADTLVFWVPKGK
jgi:hypothetical protein